MNSEKREVVKVINSWIGKQVILPSHPTFTVMASDTVDYTFESSEYRILNYVDSTGCTACNLDLIPWEDFMNEVDLKTDKEVSFLYFINAFASWSGQDVPNLHCVPSSLLITSSTFDVSNDFKFNTLT